MSVPQLKQKESGQHSILISLPRAAVFIFAVPGHVVDAKAIILTYEGVLDGEGLTSR